jgi:hypothetical protein
MWIYPVWVMPLNKIKGYYAYRISLILEIWKLKMTNKKPITFALLVFGYLMFPGIASAVTLIDQIGADDGVYDNYILDPAGAGPDNVTYTHTYDLSGFSSITSALFEVEVAGPGGVGGDPGSPLDIFIDDNFLGGSGQRSGDVLFSFDLFSLGLGSLIDGNNTIRLQAYSFNEIDVDFSRLTMEGVSAVPVPAAVWLFGTALIGLVGFGKRKSRIAV